MVDELNDVRIIGIITAFALQAIAMAGLSWEAKVRRISNGRLISEKRKIRVVSRRSF